MAIVTKYDIIRALTELGVKGGDIVIFHSSLKSMGKVEGGADAVIDAFLEAVGESGTVAVPTLSQKNFQNAYRDWTLDRPSEVGLITETFRLRPGAHRSDQATHSVAAIGRLARELTGGHTAGKPRYGIFGDTPFSHSSPWEKLYMYEAKAVFVGVTMRYNTLKHLIEYRVVERALEEIRDEKRRAELKAEVWNYDNWDDRGVWPFHDSEKLQGVLESSGLVTRAKCGDADFVCAEVKPMCDFADRLFRDEPENWYTPKVIAWLKACADATDGFKA